MPPQVSAIIPCYNSSAWIRESVASALGQSYPNLELIVVDDGSQDSTLEILREFHGKVQVLQREHTGIGAARNAGMEAASGEYLAFLDSDDVWQPEKIFRQVEFMANHPECCMLYTDAEEFRGSEIDPKSFFCKFPSLASGSNIVEAMVLDWAVPLTSTVMVRRAFLQENGIRFHPTASCAEDLSMFVEIAVHGGAISGLKEHLVRRRLHGQNASGDHYNRFLQRLTIYKELLQRFPRAPKQVRQVIEAGLRDANFWVADHYWGELNLQLARPYFRKGIAFDEIGIRCAFLWALTFAPKQAVVALKDFKRRRGAAVALEIKSASVPGERDARD